MKKAIVFGGSGFVGSHVADALMDRGIETTIFDIIKPEFLNHHHKFVQGSILDTEAVAKAVQGHNYVYHLAGQADIGIGLQEPKFTLELNIQGTINILEACRESSVDRFVFASTVYVYSDAGGFYRASKQACEIIIEEYQKNFGIDYTILRYGSLYGPRADDRNLIHRLLRQALVEKKISIGYSDDEKRDYIHVHDAARMSVDALQSDYLNQHVMLTGYQSITRGELLSTISEMLKGDVDIVHTQPETDNVQGHYKFTPYVFKPQVSKKMVSLQYTEFGQGLLNCMDEIYDRYIIQKP